ncbi:MAG: SO_0444 family Cu/Zn efflux transporter [Acidobacteriota bacterium]
MPTLLSGIAREFWYATAEMAPYLLFGFLVAGVLAAFLSPRLVERHLGGDGLGAVVKASLFGVPLPLCSCGVIPVTASLRQHGASRAATVSFLLSTPQTGVDSILATYGMLGGLFAVFRPAAALVTGIVGGMLVSLFDRTPDPVAASQADPAGGCEDACETDAEPVRGVRGALRYGFVTLPQDIGANLLVGLAVAAGIGALVPDDLLAGFGSGPVAMLAAMLIGIPIYVCATGSVPIAAALIAKGLSPGAALVFLITGPATNAATIATMWKVLGARAASLYLATVGGMALVSGLVLDALFATVRVDVAEHLHEMRPGPLGHLAAIALLVVLLAAISGPRLAAWRRSETKTMGDGLTLSIEGMTCNHCKASVERALRETAGVEHAEVDLAAGRAVVCGRGVDPAQLRARVEQLGYRVTAVEPAGA